MSYVILLALPVLIVIASISGAAEGTVWVVNWLRDRRARRVARIEAELDRTQIQLRASILQLAEQLGGDAHEARKALIRESYLASAQIPPPER